MRKILPINRPMQEHNIAQDAPGTILSRGALLWYPPVSTTRNLEDAFRASTLLNVSHAGRRCGRYGKLHKPQFPTASTPIISLTRRRGTTKNAASVPSALSQQRGSPQSPVPGFVPAAPSIFAAVSRSAPPSTTAYLLWMLSVLCPIMAIAADRDTPSRSRFRTAVRRKSCRTRPGQPAAEHALSKRHGSP